MGEAYITRRGARGKNAPTAAAAFGDNDWGAIAAVSNYIETNALTAANIEETFGWHIGDVKSVAMGGFVGELRIIGLNHDDKVDGGKAGITLELAPVCYGLTTADRRYMNATNTNANGWGGSYMRNTVMPELEALLPADLQAVIKRVNKSSSDGTSNIIVTQDRLFLPSMYEIKGITSYSFGSSYAGEGYRYAWYEANDATASRIKQQPAGTNYFSWTRSASTTANAFIAIAGTSAGVTPVTQYAGEAKSSSPSAAYGVSFAFCV